MSTTCQVIGIHHLQLPKYHAKLGITGLHFTARNQGEADNFPQVPRPVVHNGKNKQKRA